MAMLNEREAKPRAAPALVIPKDFSSFLGDDDSFYSELSGKSAQDRKAALCKAAAVFQSLQISEADLEANQQTIIEALKRSLRNDEQEKILAARILALFAITDPNYCATLTQDFEDILEKIILIDQSSVPIEAVKAWGTLLFINSDDNKTLLVLDKFLNILTESENSSLQSAILDTITFCVTTFSSEMINNEIIPRYGPEIEALVLSTEEWNVQVAASQCLAVLFSLFREEHDSDEELENCISVHQVVEYLESFASMKILSLSNEEQKTVRNKFKESLRVIKDDFCPEEVRTIEKQNFTFDNWREVTQIRWFADKLQGGLPNHFTQNPFLQQVFNVDPHLFTSHGKWQRKLTKADKREFFSKNSVSSKERTLERRRNQRRAI